MVLERFERLVELGHSFLERQAGKRTSGLQRVRENELANVVVDFVDDEVWGLDVDQVGPARNGVEVVVLQGLLQKQLVFWRTPVRACAHDVDGAFAHELDVADQKGREGLHVHIA